MSNILYHGMDKKSSSEIELMMEHFYKNPTEQHLNLLEDRIVKYISGIEEEQKSYWWDLYVKCQQHYIKL